MDPLCPVRKALTILLVLSAGTAVSFGVDATVQPYENENAAYFALSTLCWPILYFVAWKCTTDTNYLTEAGVVAPLHVRKELGIEGLTLNGATTDRKSQEARRSGARTSDDEKVRLGV